MLMLPETTLRNSSMILTYDKVLIKVLESCERDDKVLKASIVVTHTHVRKFIIFHSNIEAAM